ncbi:MAG TPA: hypothetical protein VFG04_16875 [Planctomycetaceae bacterium]|jgi:hypothetical protein|nr:hypothetical protein [Planctomycetaceae bacterium]
MSQAIVGRIFWKELRVQRAFWVWILALGVSIQLAPLFFGLAYYRSLFQFHWFSSVNIVMACCFAVGSTAIAFAGETESRTKSLFQRLPVRTAELLVGKVGWSLVGTYVLFLLLALLATFSEATWGATVSNNASSRYALSQQATDFWVSLVAPIPFLVVGLLCSLGFRDVLTTVAVSGAAAAVLMGVTDRGNWWVALVVFVAVAVVDGLLVPYWLRDSLSARLWRFTSSGTARGHSTLGVRSTVAWRRAASSLLWKEWRQARALTLTLMGVGTLAVLLCAAAVAMESRSYTASRESLRWFKESQTLVLIGVGLIPLFFGIGAGRADRRDGAFRLLANSGVSPISHWLTKHAVWLGLALGTAGWFLALDRLLDSNSFWETAQSAANATFYRGFPFGGLAPPEQAGFAVTLAIILFDVLLQYALGHLLSSTIPSAMTALVLGLIGCLALAMLWATVTGTGIGIPFWWTIGLLPPIFLLTGWLRTRDWLVDRNSLAAWSRVAAGLVLPSLGICCAIAVFRVVEIPATTLPIEFQEPERSAAEVVALKQSLFVEAAKSLTGPQPPETHDPERHTVADGWEFADAPMRDWVAANEPAVKLALQAAQQERGDFPSFEWPARVDGAFSGEAAINLMRLLLASARKLESEDKLDAALENYVAVARLGDDLKRSNRLRSGWRVPLQDAALGALDQWAAHPKQNTALIKRAISLFQHFEQDTPSDATAILNGWRIERKMFQNNVWEGKNIHEENRSAAETGFVRWCLPWELLRLQRLQDAMFATALDGVQLVERQLRERRFVDFDWNAFEFLHTPWKWERMTLGPPNDSPNGSDWKAIPVWLVNQAATARMHFIVWAALDYRREHHKVPATLSELVPVYFTWLPIDPWTGRGFHYEPKGIPAPLRTLTGSEVPKDQPFLASGGAFDCRIDVNASRGEAVVRSEVLTRERRQTRDWWLPVLDYPAPALAILKPITHESTDRPPPKPAQKPPAGHSPLKK